MSSNAPFTEPLAFALQQAGNQLSRAFEGLTPELWDTSLDPATMSPRVQVAHLAECYQAVLEKAAGREHAWGTMTIATENPEQLLAEWRTLRDRAVTAVLDPSASTELKAVGVDFILLHDAYHVGQLAMIRVARDPSFDPYSIYQ